MLEPGRQFNAGSQYRYGFNGKEQDGDIDGTGVDYDYGFRIYDARIGKFLSVDPLQEHFPWNSDYAFSEGDPINYIDLDGREKAKSNANAGNQSNSSALKAAFAHGMSDAFHNSLSIGILDALPKSVGGTDNAKDYDESGDAKAAYYRGRIAGDALAAAAGNVEQDVGGGMSVQGGLVTVGSGGTAALAGGGEGEALAGGTLALHGTFVITIAGKDAAIATGKLFQLNMAAKSDISSSTDNAANSANGEAPNKPKYENPGHHDPKSANFNKQKSVLPDNAEQLFEKSVPDPKDPKTRWAKEGNGKDAVYHRFQSEAKDGSSPFHWNGSTNAKLKNGNSNAISLNNVPVEIKRLGTK